MKKCFGWMALTMLAVLVAGSAHAGVPILLPKPGQVGFSLQGQYGTLLSSGNLGDEFGSGGGLAVRVRYRMRYERALGISFEGQTLDARESPTADTSRTTLNMLLSGVDFYQMFNTDQKMQQFISLGAGIAQIHFETYRAGPEYPLAGDGVYVTVGAGLERFFYRSFAFDLSGRYLAVFEDGKANHDFQAAGGIIFYASY